VKVLNGLEDLCLEFLLIEALHDEAERLAATTVPRLKPPMRGSAPCFPDSVRKGLQLLPQEGLVEPVQGGGTFVKRADQEVMSTPGGSSICWIGPAGKPTIYVTSCAVT
jgi:hypothetical protein